MNQQEIINKLNGLKGNLQHLLSKKMHRSDETTEEVEAVQDGADNFVDDLPLTLSRDPSPGIKFYSTENAEIARGAAKEPARGLDKFGEKDTFDFDEADDYQTNRDRNQNSDLSKRFYTNGLDIEDLNH